jgi:hypothetical protein
MKLKDIVGKLPCSVRTGEDRLDTPVTGGYACDLLSDVIAHGKPGDVWVTMHVHENIVAVAVLKELAAIVIVQGRQPAPETLAKAAKEHVAILVSELPAFETIGALHALLQDGG